MFVFTQELKRVASLKQQLESYKRQTLEVQNKMAEETKRGDKAEFELKRIQDKLAILQREKDVRIKLTYEGFGGSLVISLNL